MNSRWGRQQRLAFGPAARLLGLVDGGLNAQTLDELHRANGAAGRHSGTFRAMPAPVSCRFNNSASPAAPTPSHFRQPLTVHHAGPVRPPPDPGHPRRGPPRLPAGAGELMGLHTCFRAIQQCARAEGSPSRGFGGQVLAAALPPAAAPPDSAWAMPAMHCGRALSPMACAAAAACTLSPTTHPPALRAGGLDLHWREAGRSGGVGGPQGEACLAAGWLRKAVHHLLLCRGVLGDAASRPGRLKEQTGQRRPPVACCCRRRRGYRLRHLPAAVADLACRPNRDHRRRWWRWAASASCSLRPTAPSRRCPTSERVGWVLLLGAGCRVLLLWAGRCCWALGGTSDRPALVVSPPLPCWPTTAPLLPPFHAGAPTWACPWSARPAPSRPRSPAGGWPWQPARGPPVHPPGMGRARARRRAGLAAWGTASRLRSGLVAITGAVCIR